jgi:hypothetical protein
MTRGIPTLPVLVALFVACRDGRTQLTLVGCAAFAFLLIAPGTVQAQAQFHACYMPSSGVVYRIKAPGLKDKCQTPAPGSSGGFTDLEIVYGTPSICSPGWLGGPGLACGAAVICPDGKLPIAGGYATGAGFGSHSLDVVYVLVSEPFVSDNGIDRGWMIQVVHTTLQSDGTPSDHGDVSVRASVMCVDGGL